MLETKTKYSSQFITVLWIASFWILISILQLLYEYAILTDYGATPRWAENGQFLQYFVLNTFTFLIIGLVGGLTIVYFLQRWFRTLPYGLAILYLILCFSILFIVLTSLNMYILAIANVEWERVHEEVWNSLLSYFLSFEFFKNFVFWLLILIVTLIALFVRDKYGPGLLLKFLLGQYFHPKREERIFMFLDLKGSTTIAEQLGENKYFNFLREVFATVTPPILETNGEIY